jgi:hypothetical protein
MVLASELFDVSGEVVLVTGGGGTGIGSRWRGFWRSMAQGCAGRHHDPESLEAGRNPFWRLAVHGLGGADGCAR